MNEYIDHLYELLSKSSQYNVPLINIKRILKFIPYDELHSAFEEYIGAIPLIILIRLMVDPFIFRFMYNILYPTTESLLTIHNICTFIPHDIKEVGMNEYRVTDIAKDALEDQYTSIFYTSREYDKDVVRLDEYARVCGVTYEKKTPYGPRPVLRDK